VAVLVALQLRKGMLAMVLIRVVHKGLNLVLPGQYQLQVFYPQGHQKRSCSMMSCPQDRRHKLLFGI